MKNFQKPVCLSLIWCLIFSSLTLYGESVDEKFTEITPHFAPGAGEFTHGAGYGKLMMRVMMFGAVPSQGIHYMPEGTDLLFAIIYAGGKGETTKLNGITIRRRDKKELIKVDLDDLIEDGKPVPKLVDGDLINVPFNWRKDYQEFLFLTSVFSSITGLVLCIVALTHRN